MYSNRLLTTNKPLDELMEKLTMEEKSKKDIVIDPRTLYMCDGKLESLTKAWDGRLDLTEWGLSQLSSRLSIPVRYLRECPPELMDRNVNHWLHNRNLSDAWMLRTRGAGNLGLVRGIVSDKYSKFDDVELVEILKSLLDESGKDYKLVQMNRDDGSTHLRLTFPDLETTIGTTLDGKPDVHQVGLHITNSEVGKRALNIAPMVYRLVCTNGLMRWVNDGDTFNQRHIYLRHNEMLGRVSEAVGKGLRVGNELIDSLVAAKSHKIENPFDVIDKIAKDRKYSQALTDKVKEAYMIEPGKDAFYLTQAWTRAAQGLSADDRADLEFEAGSLLDKFMAVA